MTRTDEIINILEHEYDVEGVENIGPPTVEEIVKRLQGGKS